MNQCSYDSNESTLVYVPATYYYVTFFFPYLVSNVMFMIICIALSRRPSQSLENYLEHMRKLKEALKYFEKQSPLSAEMAQVVSTVQ